METQTIETTVNPTTGKLTPDMLPAKVSEWYEAIEAAYVAGDAYTTNPTPENHAAMLAANDECHNAYMRSTRIEIGDFIKASDCPMCMGIVLKCGSVPFGKKRIEGYMVTTANGRVDFIDSESAVFIAH